MSSRGDIESGFVSDTPERSGLAWFFTSLALLLLVVMNIYMFLPDMPHWLFIILLFIAMYIGRYSNFEIQEREGQATYLQMIGRGIINRNSDALDIEDIAPQEPQLREEDINALPVHRYKVLSHKQKDGDMKGDDSEFICCICLSEEANDGDLIRTLPCRHQFHAGCITPWLQKKGTCPFCKYRIIPGWKNNDSGETSVIL